MSPAPKILFVTTHPMTAAVLLRGQLSSLQTAGFEVEVASSPGNLLAQVASTEGVRVWPVSMERSPSPLKDLWALGRLIRVLKGARPQIVNASTPKAAFLGLIAARLCAVPIRVYTLRGLRLESCQGKSRTLLRWVEKVTANCAHKVVSVSSSLRDQVVVQGLISPAKVIVLGSGSSNGVDTNRYHPVDLDERSSLRAALGLPQEASVIGFVGRLTADKGIEDLSKVVESLTRSRAHLCVILIGEAEDETATTRLALQRLDSNAVVVAPGFVDDPSPYYQVMDVLVFPSYREGFPNAPLEAAASGVPVVAYASTGTTDAVVNGVTGTLVERGDRGSLEKATLRYLEDPQLRENHGREGRARALGEYRQEVVWETWATFYRRILEEHDESA